MQLDNSFDTWNEIHLINQERVAAFLNQYKELESLISRPKNNNWSDDNELMTIERVKHRLMLIPNFCIIYNNNTKVGDKH